MAIRIRTKIIASLSAVLIILSLIVSIAYYNRNLLFYGMIELENRMNEFNVISRLQVSVERAVMPANDYLITGDRKEKLKFDRTADEIKKDLAWLIGLSHQEHADFDREALKRFTVLELKAHEIFAIQNPVGNARGAILMKEIDAISSDISANHLGRTLDVIKKESQKEISSAREIRERVDALILLGAVAGLAAVVIIIMYLSKSIVRPLALFKEGAVVIGKGNLDHRIDLKDGVEMNHLAEAFNRMTEKLKNSYSDLEKKVEDRTRELNESNIKLQELSVTDGLTGAFNHRYFYGKLNEEAGRASRYQRTFSLIMSDVDNFKHYNDTNGHMAGDEVLKGIASCIRAGLRKEDVFARYGGEEFAIILPETDKVRAIIVAERLRESVASHHFSNGASQPGGRVSISIGIASFPDDASDGSELIAKADGALYAAKEKGRNRVEACHAQSAESSVEA